MVGREKVPEPGLLSFSGGVSFVYLLRDDGRQFHVSTALGVTGWGADAQYYQSESCIHNSTFVPAQIC